MEQSKAVFFHNAYINADTEELDRLWQEEAPKTFIKFYPAKYEPDGTNYFLEHLLNKTLWLSSPALFNDPFDSLINFDYRNLAEQTSKKIIASLVGNEAAQVIMATDNARTVVEGASNLLQRDIGDIHRYFEESIYTTCFADIDNLKSLRMWAYYANCHTGVCAEYAASDVKQATPFLAIPVKYTDTYEYIIDSKSVNDDVSNYLKFFTKSSEWEYEKEWRVSHKQEYFRGKGYSIEFVQPKKIYLGCRAGDRLKDDVIRAAHDQGIELFQMTKRPGSFCMDAIKI